MPGVDQQNADLNFLNTSKIINLPNAVNPQDPVTLAQLNANLEGVNWKDSVRAASVGQVSIASAPAAIDGVTLANGDRVLLKDQTAQAENGIRIFTAAAAALNRAQDANTSTELEAAVVVVEEGTVNVGTRWRQTQTNFVLDTNNVVWTGDGGSAPPASETTAGIAEIATQGETDTGTDDLRFVTPLKLATYSGRAKRNSGLFGDGSATSFTVTHGLDTEDISLTVRLAGGTKEKVNVAWKPASTTQVTIDVNVAPASNAYRWTAIA